ncbi:glycosyltransferase 87 family protein [Amycolatopsis sp. YIM 10]|uniref:glycosyltransferase 87 family protein n=1 Tax=Amycolatopsis sp. YIM 10 TaxID=2653857 RepID=UPI0012904034|nr:glycosyltransferase 87 family protein [Amycolatopsis sp. YIM 10]
MNKWSPPEVLRGLDGPASREGFPAVTAKKLAALTLLVFAAITVRTLFFDYRSGDYNAFLLRWYEFIEQNGGWRALRQEFSNYNAPYLYLLVVLSYLPVPPLIGIKLISVVFDFVLAYFAYRLVDLRYPGRWWPLPAGAVVVFLPTVVLNSSMWAQADSIYSAFALGGLYFALRHRPYLACAFFGLALAFKLQAIFLFPVLLLLVLAKRVPWRALLLVPAVYLVLDVPALLIGADPVALLTIYATQTETYGQLTLNAPNAYQFLTGVTDTDVLKAVGVALTGALLLGGIVALLARATELTTTRILLLATVSALLVPYFLPAMHERYFYLADVLTVVAAFHLPRLLWPLPILTQFASLFSYLPYLAADGGFGGTAPAIVDFRVLAMVMLGALVLAVWVTVEKLVEPGPSLPEWTRSSPISR